MQKKTLTYLFILFNTLTLFPQEKTLKIEINDKSNLNKALTYKTKHTNLKSVDSTFSAIKDSLTKYGYLNLTTDSSKLAASKKTFYVTLHQKVDSIILKKHPIHQTLTIPIELLPIEIKNITNRLNDLGTPFSKVTLTEIQTEGNILSANISIENLTPRKIDSIIIHGYENFPKTFLKYYASIKKGNTLNINKIAEQSQKINNLTFASEIKQPEILFKENNTQVHLYYKKRIANYFDGFIGFGNNEDNNKFTINGSVDINLINNLNTGESLKIYWKNNGKDRSEFEGTLNIPYVFKTRTNTLLSLKINRQDSTFNNTSFNIEESYFISSRSKIGLSYTDNNSTTTNNNNLNISNFKSIYIGAIIDFLDNNTINPILQDKKLKILLATGHRTLSNTKTQQQLIELEGYYQYKLTDRSRLFIQNKTQSLLSKDYLDNELFYFGGINSIRGFSENSIPASLYTTFNVEYRFLASAKLYMHTITDYNYNENRRTNTKNHLYSLGFGIGILNKQSIFKLNYAVGWNTTGESSLNDSKLHISYSAFF